MMTAKPASLSHVTIKAEFVLDNDGQPSAFQSGKFSRRRHYKIRLSVNGAPDDAHAVTYSLHETYRDPVREILDGPDFPLEITAYGDYEVVVKVRRKRFPETFRATLSSALRATYGSDPSDTHVAEAISDIKRS